MYSKSYTELLEAMRNFVIANQEKLTDFNEGSIALSLLEAPAREIAALYNKTIANIELYAKDMAYAQFDFEKKGGVEATGPIIFTRATASSITVTIPAGTSVSSDDGVSFVSSADASISAGETESAIVPATCAEVGDVGNVGISKISTIDDAVYGVDGVRNDTAFTGGVNAETDEEYKSRFHEFIVGLGQSSVSGVRATALSVNGIRSVSLVEHFPSVDGYHFTVYAENGSGALPAATKLLVEAAVCGSAETDGVRACGVNARVLAPQIVYITVSVVFRVDGTIPSGLIEEALIGSITNYVNSLKIGASYDKKIVYNMLIKQGGVADVTSMSPSTQIVSKNQIIRLGKITVEGV